MGLVTGMVNRNHKVFVWCPKGPLCQHFADAGAVVVNREIDFDIDPSYIYSLYKFLRRKKVDVLHAHELKAVTNAVLAGFFARTPVRITHTHTPISEWKIPALKKRLTLWGYAPLINIFATREIALTESRKVVKMAEGIREFRLVVIPNGVDVGKFDFDPLVKENHRKEVLEKYNIPKDAFVFGFMSRISQEKGHFVLVEAFKDLLDRVNSKDVEEKKIHLLIAGGGVLESRLREKISELDLDARVRVTGVFDQKELPKFYASFDAFVFPSLAEGFGYVLVEAMAAGLSVICSDIPVLQEVGGSTVMYFETGNSSRLAEKMYDLYVRYDQFKVLRTEAKTRVKELFSIEKFLEAYENLYKLLLS